ncbi:hypothetical protein ACFL5O_05700 [Myxococcota bacterium]
MRKNTIDTPKKRRLARTVGSKNRNDLVLANGAVYLLEDSSRPVAEAESVDLEAHRR